MVKVDVISGFLGAGKTTLIKKLFSARMGKERIALIENEFGEIGIDGSFLKESGVKIKEINSGCICCSLVGNFEKSLKEMIDVYKPDRIIIEPSGVGKLSDIVAAITNTGLDLKINVLCTVVDGGKCKMYLKNFGEFYIDQVSEANVIVVSKSDKLSEEKTAAAVELLKQYNDKATFITTPLELLDGETLLKNLEGNASLMDELIEELNRKHAEHHHHHHHGEECDDPECECHHHHDDEGHECHHHEDEEEHECHHHEDEECDDPECECHHHHGHHADEVFASWGTETPVSYTKAELNGILQALCGSSYGMILRAKGIVKGGDFDGWYHFDLVAGEYEIREGAADVTGKLCVIGSGIDKEAIEKLFLKR
ncbi:MAG: GTP-binding protein [Clostridiales bacterium]|nr:GTP-binding protein [Clostridiales bacterium]